MMAKADVRATLIEDCDPVFITSHGLHVPEEPGGELQTLPSGCVLSRDLTENIWQIIALFL